MIMIELSPDSNNFLYPSLLSLPLFTFYTFLTFCNLLPTISNSIASFNASLSSASSTMPTFMAVELG